MDDADIYEFEIHRSDVIGVVSFRDKACSCHAFALYRYLCVHAFIVYRERNINIYNLCNPFYINKTLCNAYSKIIHSLEDPKQWHVYNTVFARVVLRPRIHKKTGKPRVNRILFQGKNAM